MAKQVISRVLETFLGKFIDGLSGDALRVDLWSGELRLENLALKEDALNDFNLPIKVAGGSVRKVVVVVPWNQLGSSSVKIHIEGVYVLAVPHAELPSREELRKEKKTELERLEVYRQQARLVHSSKDDSSFLSRLTTKIVDNLVLTVSDIHIRYEDTLSNAKQPFAVGLVLSSFSLKTTDAEGHEIFVDRGAGDAGHNGSSDLVHKLLAVKRLGCYCSRVDRFSLLSTLSREELRQVMQLAIDNESGQTFLLSPLSVSFLMTKNESLDFSVFPKYSLLANIDNVSLGLRREQYVDLLLMQKGFANRIAIVSVFKKQNRPTVPPKVAPKLWWRYMAVSVKPDLLRKMDWQSVKKAGEERSHYKKLYMQLKLGEALAPSAVSFLSTFEDQWANEVVLNLRDRAEDEAAKLRKQNKAVAAAGAPVQSSSWYGYFFGKGAPASSSSGAASQSQTGGVKIPHLETEGALITTEEGIKDLKTSIEHLEEVEATILSSNALLFSFEGDLKAGSLCLYAEGGKKLVRLDFAGAVQAKSWASSWTMSFSLSKLAMVHSRPEETNFPTILSLASSVQEKREVRNQQRTGQDNQELQGSLSFQFWSHPFDSSDDYRFRVTMPSFNVVVDLQRLSSYGAFFEEPHAQVLWANASQSFSEWFSSREHELSEILLRRKKWDILIDMDAPIFVIPEDTTASDAAIVIVDLGHFTLSNLHSVKRDETKNIEEGQREDTANSKVGDHSRTSYGAVAGDYDHWQLDMSRMQIIVLSYSSLAHNVSEGPVINQGVREDILTQLRVSGTRKGYSLVHPFSVSLDVFTLIESKGKVEKESKVSFEGKLPLLKVTASDQEMKRVLKVATAISKQIQAHGKSGADGVSSRQEPYNDPEDLRSPVAEGVGRSVAFVQDRRPDDKQDKGPQVQPSLLSASFVVEKIELHLSSWDERRQRESKLIELHMVGAVTSANLAMDQTRFSARLEGVRIIDQLYPPSSAFHVLVSSGHEERASQGPQKSLIVLEVTSYLQDAIAQEALTVVRCHFNALRLNWNPSTMAMLSRLAAEISPISGEGVEGQESQAYRLERIGSKEEQRLLSEARASSQADGGSCCPARILVEAMMNEVSITFNKDFQGRRLATFSVHRSVFTYREKGRCYELRGELGQMIGEDHSRKGNLHSRFFSTSTRRPLLKAIERPADGEENEVQLKFSLQTFDKSASDYPGHDALASLSLGSTVLVYLHQQVLELSDYLLQGVLGVIISSAVAYAADAVTDASFLTKIAVKIQQPEIIIPVSAASEDYLSLQASELELSHLPRVALGNKSPSGRNGGGGRELFADMKRITMSDLVLTSSKHRCLVRSPISAVIEVKDLGYGYIDPNTPVSPAPSPALSPLSASESGGQPLQPRFTIAATIPAVQFVVPKSSYVIFMSLLSHNFGEPSTVMNEEEKAGVRPSSTSADSLPTSGRLSSQINSPLQSDFGSLQSPETRREVHYAYADDSVPPSAMKIVLQIGSTSFDATHDAFPSLPPSSSNSPLGQQQLSAGGEGAQKTIARFSTDQLSLTVDFPIRAAPYLTVEVGSMLATATHPDPLLHPQHRKLAASKSPLRVKYLWSDEEAVFATLCEVDKVEVVYVPTSYAKIAEYFKLEGVGAGQAIDNVKGKASVAKEGEKEVDRGHLGSLDDYLQGLTSPISPRMDRQPPHKLMSQAQERDGTLRYLFDLNARSLSIAFAKDLSVAATPTLVMKTDVKLSRHTVARSADVNDAASLSFAQYEVLARNCHRPGCGEQDAQLIEPTQLSVSYEEITEVEASVRRTISCSTEAIDMLLSFEDLSFLSEMYGSLLSTSSASHSSDPQTTKRDRDREDEAADSYSLFSDSRSTKGEDEVQRQQLHPAFHTLTSVECQMGRVSLIFINDCDGCDIPLFQVGLEKGSWFANGDSEKLSGGAELFFASKYFEPHSLEWRPLMDGWQARLALVMQSSSMPRTQFIVEADSPLSVHITDGLLETLASAAGTWRRRAEKMDGHHLRLGGKKALRARAPVVLLNESGMSFDYWVNDEVETRHKIEMAQACPIPFSHSKGAGTGILRAKLSLSQDEEQVVNLYFGEPYAPILNVGVDLIGVTSYALLDATGKQRSSLFIDCRLEDGRFVSTICSKVRMMNFTPLEVEVLANDPRWESPQALGSVFPGDTKSLPLASAEASELRIRPVTDEGEVYSWSAPILIQNGTRSTRTKVVAQFSQGVECVFCAESQYKSGIVVVSIYPPIGLLNLLPVPLGLNLMSNNPNQGVIASNLPSGEEGYCMHFHSSQALRLQLKLPGCAPSEWLSFSLQGGGGSKKKTVGCTVRRSDGGKLKLLVQAEEAQNGILRFAIYAQCWIVNRTGLPLVISNFVEDWDGISCSTLIDTARLFMFQTEPGGSDSFRVRVPGSQWSEPFKPDPTNLNWQNEVLHCATTNSTLYEFGVSTDYDTEKFGSFTKIVNIFPRYLLVNNCTCDLLIKEGTYEGSLTVIASGVKQPFYWASGRWNPISVSLGQHYYGWSEHFKIEKAGSFEVSIPGDVARGASSERQPIAVNVTFGGLEEASMLVVFTEGGLGLDRAVVKKLNEIVYGESVRERTERDGRGTRGSMIREMSNVDYDSVYDWQIPGLIITLYSSTALGNRNGGANKERQRNTKTKLSSRLQSSRSVRLGMSRGSSFVPSQIVTDTVRTARLLISRVRILLRAQSSGQQNVQFTCGSLQLEDLSPQSKYPVVLTPVLKRDASFFQVLLQIQEYPGVYVVNTFLVQCGDIRLQTSSTFAQTLNRVTSDIQQYFTAKPHSVSRAVDLLSEYNARAEVLSKRWGAGGHKVFVDTLSFEPINLLVSFERLPEEEAESSSFSLVQNLRLRIDGASLTLPRFMLKKVYGTQESFMDSLMAFYSKQLRGQVFGLLDSIEVTTLVTDSVTNVFSSLIGKVDQRLEEGFKYESLSNRDIVSKHSKAFERCDSRECFNRQLTHLIFDWDSNHTGVGARACVAVAILNNSRQDLVVNPTLAEGAELHPLPQRSLLRRIGTDGSSRWRPDRALVLFAFGYIPSPLNFIASGNIKLVIRCNGFNAVVEQDQGQVISKMGYSAAFVEQETTKWWSKFVLIVGDDLREESLRPSSRNSSSSSLTSDRGTGDSIGPSLQSQQYEVLFEAATLGMRVEEESNQLIVTSFNRTSNGSPMAAEKSGKIKPGDVLVSVNGALVRSMNQFFSLVKSSPRPLVIRFEKPPSSRGSISRENSNRRASLAAETSEDKAEWSSLFG